MSDAIKVGSLLLLIYGVWLYNRRALGITKLSLAPATWLAFLLATILIKNYSLQNSSVSGYSYQPAWVSMNDNPHPETWEVNYAGENAPLLIAVIAPILGAIILRVVDGWVFRNFLALGLIAWIVILFIAGDAFRPNKKQYYDKNTLPPIGYPARTFVY
jgi:hypothetical protein